MSPDDDETCLETTNTPSCHEKRRRHPDQNSSEFRKLAEMTSPILFAFKSPLIGFYCEKAALPLLPWLPSEIQLYCTSPSGCVWECSPLTFWHMGLRSRWRPWRPGERSGWCPRPGRTSGCCTWGRSWCVRVPPEICLLSCWPGGETRWGNYGHVPDNHVNLSVKQKHPFISFF